LFVFFILKIPECKTPEDTRVPDGATDSKNSFNSTGLDSEVGIELFYNSVHECIDYNVYAFYFEG
jgi:hypothetical protein